MGELNVPRSELIGIVLERILRAYVEVKNGYFLRTEDGSLHLALGGRRIPLTYDRDNVGMAELMLEACNVTTLSAGAQAALQRFKVHAAPKAARSCLRFFSALSPSRERLYVPIADGELLQITAQELRSVPNGENEDSLWIEHPYGDPLLYKRGANQAGLALFERLLVDTQACRIPEMRWLVAMHEGFFPYVRDICRARALLVHVGATQQGKTSGAQRFTLLHGLGQVKGDFSVAALGNLKDIGLLVLDNKEQTNFHQTMIDFCLFLSTGAERGRSSVDGDIRTSNNSRPVCVITTIEGTWKPELQARCVEVQYEVSGAKTEREPIEDEIQRRRHEILSSMVLVFQRWLTLASDGRTWPSPLPDFPWHFSALCNFLCAFGELSGKPEGWAESIIDTWSKALGRREADEDELEQPLRRVFAEQWADLSSKQTTYQGKSGTLYISDCGTLLACLQRLNLRDRTLPKNETGLGRRLRSAKFKGFVFLDTDTPNLPVLQRTARKRPVGFFVEDDTVTGDDRSQPG